MSINRIAEKLGVSRASVSKWVRDIPLTPEQKRVLTENQKQYGAQHKGSVANRKKRRAIRVSYQNEGRIKAQEGDPLHLTGCMLYWAEGRKKRDTCSFSNSDAEMMFTFVRFLRECLAVKIQRSKSEFSRT